MKIHLLFFLGMMTIAKVLGDHDDDDCEAVFLSNDDDGEGVRKCAVLNSENSCKECCRDECIFEDNSGCSLRKCTDNCIERGKCSDIGNDDHDDCGGRSKCSNDNEGKWWVYKINGRCEKKWCKDGCIGKKYIDDDWCESSSSEDECSKDSHCRWDEHCDDGHCVEDSSDDTDTTFLSSDQTHKCSRKDSEDSCERCCENKCSNKSNSDDQLDNCKDHCIEEADCSEASSSDGRSCSSKISDCCHCLEDECHVESGDSADSSDKDCVKDECKNRYCKDAGECEYGDRSDWKWVVRNKCDVDW